VSRWGDSTPADDAENGRQRGRAFRPYAHHQGWEVPHMARENAHPTIAKMSAGLVAASVAAPTATKNSRTRATVSRRIASACGSSIL
jgi:hypothetical protein